MLTNFKSTAWVRMVVGILVIASSTALWLALRGPSGGSPASSAAQTVPDTATPDDSREIGPTNDLFNAADIRHGEKIAISCLGCHSIGKGEAHKLGPNLFRVAGHRIARHKDYTYSEALKAKAQEHWTINNLDRWFRNPEDFASGNKMTFDGLGDPQDRMDLIAYLISLQ